MRLYSRGQWHGRGSGIVFRLQSNILETEIKTAARVAKLVFESGLARVDRPADMEAFIRSHVYRPDYKNLVTPQQLLVGVADGSKTSPVNQSGRTLWVRPDWGGRMLGGGWDGEAGKRPAPRLTGR